jgi:hypothetical protein
MPADPQDASQLKLPPGATLESPAPDAAGAMKLPPGATLESAGESGAGAIKTEEPGFLDKDIPLTGHSYNPTLSGVQSIGRGFRSAYEGAKNTLDPSIHPGEEGIAAPGIPGVIARPIARIGMGLYDTAKQVPEIPDAIRDINASPDPLSHYARAAQNTAGEGAAQAVVGAATEGAARFLPRVAAAVPQEVATAPVRAAARTAEGVVNSSPLRYVRGGMRLLTPADEARAMIRVPGRDFGLTAPEYPGAPFPERPLPAVMQARGLQTGGYSPVEPSEALARIPATGAEPDTSLAVNPRGKIGGRYVLMPEEVEAAEQIQRIAARRASERGMQYAAGMRPSGGKVAAP